MINADEAERVRSIFNWYLGGESVFSIVAKVAQLGWRNKQWTTRAETLYGGLVLGRSHLYNLLANILYTGQLRVDNVLYPGEHEAIIDKETFDLVQARLKQNSVNGDKRHRTRMETLLRGLIYCSGCGSPMYQTYSSSNERRYRYYVCSRSQQPGDNSCAARSVSAPAVELRVNRVRGRCSRSSMVRFVENEHGAGTMLPEPVAQGRSVLFIAQQGVRDDELRVRCPRVDCVTAFATTIEEVVSVEDHEAEAEAGLHFALPLSYEGGRTGNHDALNFLAHDHLTENEASFDSFAESNVIGDKEVDARHLERLFQRLQLVRHDLDAGAVRRLEQARIRGCYKVPAEGMQVGGENVWGVEALAREMPPVRLLKYLGVDFAFPEDGEAFTLSVIFQAGKIDKCLLPAGLPGGFDSFYQVSPAANLYNLAK